MIRRKVVRHALFLTVLLPFIAVAQDVIGTDASGKCPAGYFLFVTNTCVNKVAMDTKGVDHIVKEVEKHVAGNLSGAGNPESVKASPGIESMIEGEFEGWDGETIVKLINGQVWEQSEYYYHYHYAYRPKVRIFMKSGRYVMKVDGIDKAVGVRRIR